MVLVKVSQLVGDIDWPGDRLGNFYLSNADLLARARAIIPKDCLHNLLTLREQDQPNHPKH